MEFTVKRSTWLRGEGLDASYLLRSDGKKCCLGFLGNACGIKDDDLHHRRGPIDLYGENWPTTFFEPVDDEGHPPYQSEVCYNLMRCNDAASISDEQREERLVELFASIGITVRFED